MNQTSTSRAIPPRKLSMTKKEAERALLREALDLVLDKVKKVRIAEACDVSKPAVGQWERVPQAYIREVAELSRLPLKKVRPDIHDPNWKDLVAAKMQGVPTPA